MTTFFFRYDSHLSGRKWSEEVDAAEEENRAKAGVTRMSRVGYEKTRKGTEYRRNETAAI